MSDGLRTGYGNTDAAALGAAALAVAFPMFGDPGPFTPMSSVLSLTLVFLLFGYILGHQRTTAQILAVAATFALIFTPIIGFAFELGYAESKEALLKCGNTIACDGDGDLGTTSNVSPRENFIHWLVTFLAAAIILKKKNPSVKI